MCMSCAQDVQSKTGPHLSLMCMLQPDVSLCLCLLSHQQALPQQVQMGRQGVIVLLQLLHPPPLHHNLTRASQVGHQGIIGCDCLQALSSFPPAEQAEDSIAASRAQESCN